MVLRGPEKANGSHTSWRLPSLRTRNDSQQECNVCVYLLHLPWEDARLHTAVLRRRMHAFSFTPLTTKAICRPPAAVCRYSSANELSPKNKNLDYSLELRAVVSTKYLYYKFLCGCSAVYRSFHDNQAVLRYVIFSVDISPVRQRLLAFQASWLSQVCD